MKATPKATPGRIRLHVPRRRSTAAPVGNATLFVDDLRMTLDEAAMAPVLARLLPPAYAHASDPEWTPFVRRAIAMGLLRSNG